LFRNWKFVENEKDQVEAARAIIPLLKIDKEITDEAFITLYGGVITGVIDYQRGYIQQLAKKVCLGTSETFVNWPFFFVNTQHFRVPFTQNIMVSMERSQLLQRYSRFGSIAIWILSMLITKKSMTW
jgi:hypothetical protein